MIPNQRPYKLSELGSFRNGINFTRQDFGKGRPIINVKELYKGRYVSIENLDELRFSVTENRDYEVRKGDILFARSSVKASGAGQVAIVNTVPDHTVFSGFIIRFRINDTNVVLPEYLNYLLRSPLYREMFTRIATGTTITNLSQVTLGNIQVRLPSIDQQERIVRVIGSLDDKIEHNNGLNQTLEELARTIFRSWFVNFDPVRAKAEGRDTGLPSEIADLFPDGFEESAVGEIPRGWKCQSILDFANLLSGGTPKTTVDEFWNGDVCWVSARDVSNSSGLFILDTEKKISHLGVERSNAKILPKNVTVVTARGTVGACGILGKDMAINQSNYALQSKQENGDYYLFFLTGSILNNLKQNAYGTIFDTITTSTFENVSVILPPKNLIRCFDDLITPFMERICLNSLESNNLALTRDHLLPKLLNEDFVLGRGNMEKSQ